MQQLSHSFCHWSLAEASWWWEYNIKKKKNIGYWIESILQKAKPCCTETCWSYKFIFIQGTFLMCLQWDILWVAALVDVHMETFLWSASAWNGSCYHHTHWKPPRRLQKPVSFFYFSVDVGYVYTMLDFSFWRKTSMECGRNTEKENTYSALVFSSNC